MSKSNNSKPNPLWGGHFTSGPAEIMEKINASIAFDKRLYAQDIKGSIAHCNMLGKQGIINKKEVDEIVAGLKEIEREIENGEFEFSVSLEDIHMNIESALSKKVGDVAGKLHTARSRNDQVATDFKLWVRDAIDVFDKDLQKLQSVLIKRAKQYSDVVIPGFTHLQTAQPVTFGHHLLAYVEMISRDRGRLNDARARLNQCPLGAAALAGTSFDIDRFATAKELGFDCPTANSLDTVSDRDFAIEFLSSLSMTAMHLSRLSEEIVLWVSDGFKFIKLSNAYTTGSSIMPQKRNPDAAELVRSKTGRINGALISLLTVMKGLPLAYSKDMQEDKEPVFDAAENMSLSIHAMIGMIGDMQVNESAMKERAMGGYSTATDIADWCVQNLGIPFRQCHSITGKIVQLAESKSCRLDELSLTDMQSIENGITEDIFNVLSVENSVRSRKSFGGTAPDNVKEQVKLAEKKYL